MTDAREIIARHLCVMAAQTWSGISPFERAAYRTTAQGMVEAITSAGIRILGPDEVDQVTVEYEIWTVGDEPELCAGSSDRADAEHYALVYGQDEPVEIIEVIRRALGRKA